MIMISNCHFVCMQADRLSQDKDLDSPSGQHKVLARPDKGGFEIPLTDQEWRDFTALTIADWLEQVHQL